MATKSKSYKKAKKTTNWKLPLLLVLVLVAVGFGIFVVFFSKAGTTSPQVYLATSNNSSVATVPNSSGFTYGAAGDKIIACDWDGVPYGATNGSTVAAYRPSNSTFYISNNNASVNADPNLVFTFGATGDIPLCGNWDINNGSAKPTVAVYRPSDSTFYLSDSTNKAVRTTYQLGSPGDIPIACDWNGDGVTDLGVYNPATSTFKLALKIFGSYGVFKEFTYGINGGSDIPVCGNWTNKQSTTTNEFSTVGVYRTTDAKFYLRNSNSSGPADIKTPYGVPSDKFVPLVGNWTGTKQTFIGAYRPGVVETASAPAPATTTSTAPAPIPTAAVINGSSVAECTTKTLRRGNTGTCLSYLIFILRSKGYNVAQSELDSLTFGSDTESKVRAFQTAAGISVDGVVGPITWGKLTAAGSGADGSGETSPLKGQTVTSFLGGATIASLCFNYNVILYSAIDIYDKNVNLYDRVWPGSTGFWRSGSGYLTRFQYTSEIAKLKGMPINCGITSNGSLTNTYIYSKFNDYLAIKTFLNQATNDINKFPPIGSGF